MNGGVYFHSFACLPGKCGHSWAVLMRACESSKCYTNPCSTKDYGSEGVGTMEKGGSHLIKATHPTDFRLCPL